MENYEFRIEQIRKELDGRDSHSVSAVTVDVRLGAFGRKDQHFFSHPWYDTGEDRSN